MQMIDVLKRLAELDAKNPNVVKENIEQNSDLIYISVDKIENFEDWMESEGLETNVPKRDEGTYVVYDYSNADHTSKMYADTWNEKRGVAESMGDVDIIMQTINSVEDLDQLMHDPRTPAERDAAKILREKFHGISRTEGLDVEEDFEQIAEILLDEIAAEYSGGLRDGSEGIAEGSDYADQIVSMIDNELEMGNHYEGAVISASDELNMDPREVDRIYRDNSPDSDAINPINFGSDQDPRGVAKGLNECGMMGSDMSRPRTPASINMTADSGAELTGMLRDIMQLAGLKQVGPDDLGHDHEPHVISTDPSLGAAKMDGEPMDMKSMLATIDTLNKPDDEEEMKEYSNDAPTDVAGDMDNEAMLNTGMHNHDQSGGQGSAKGRNFKNNAVAYPETMYENLMAEYRKFVNED